MISASESGRAIAEAVSRQFPTSAAWVRSHVRPCGICGGQIGTGAGFLQVRQFTLPIRIPPTTPLSLIMLLLTLYSLDTHSINKINFKKFLKQNEAYLYLI
jgi:hypothetical protein